MSSLTDIIFLLLIFFILTSSVVKVDVKLPTSDSKTQAPQDISVIVKKNGKLTFNGQPATWTKLDKRIAKHVKYHGNKDNATVLIISEVGVPWENVNKVMKIAAGLKLKAVIATQPRSN